jgi:hypothetical protein
VPYTQLPSLFPPLGRTDARSRQRIAQQPCDDHRPDTTRYRRDSSAASAGGSTDHSGEPCFTRVRLPRAAPAPLVCNLDEPMPLIPSLADAIPFPKIGWRVLQRPSIGLQCCPRLGDSDHRAGDDRSNAGPSSTACVRDPGWRRFQSRRIGLERARRARADRPPVDHVHHANRKDIGAFGMPARLFRNAQYHSF